MRSMTLPLCFWLSVKQDHAEHDPTFLLLAIGRQDAGAPGTFVSKLNELAHVCMPVIRSIDDDNISDSRRIIQAR